MDYALLDAQLRELLAGESDALANAANFAALVFHEVPDVSWAGFYYAAPPGELVLGPFQGRPACTRLPAGRGVCGRAFQARETLVVDDVGAFQDHIVCDPSARSEIVVPVLWAGSPYGVFDVDSASPARFKPLDRIGIERLVHTFMELVPPARF